MQIFICFYKYLVWSINNYVEELITSETELKVDTVIELPPPKGRGFYVRLDNRYSKVSEYE